MSKETRGKFDKSRSKPGEQFKTKQTIDQNTTRAYQENIPRQFLADGQVFKNSPIVV